MKRTELVKIETALWLKFCTIAELPMARVDLLLMEQDAYYVQLLKDWDYTTDQIDTVLKFINE